MKTSFVSSLAVQTAMRLTIQQGQSEMVRLQEEITTGRHADLGISLGAGATRSINLQRELSRMQTLKDTNSIVTQRLSGSQDALATMVEAAEKVRDTLVSFRGNDAVDKLSIQKADIQSAMTLFTAAANTSLNGEYLFAGINTDVRPLADYNDPAGSAAKATYQAALSGFMAAQVPPLTAMKDFTGDQMKDFITNTLEPMFLGGAQWDADWSNASSQNMTSRISTTEVIQSSTNVNSDAVRKFALANVIAGELLDTDIPSVVRASVSDMAMGYVSEAITGLNAERSALGVSESRVEKATTSLEAQIKIITNNKLDLEGIDTYDASVRLTALKTQIETSYTLTARLQQLSLINYL
ncbi:flagellar hook-associated family protein [Ensifer soli]|uniref:flagellar hook-associated family protein n=1 Tax=Ciceribacter sp. sgz301302 TaxID=3342379 RepID=UPI0035B78E4E